MNRWFAVRTNPRCEDRARQSIEAKGIETFVPKAKRLIVHHRTRALLTKSFPLFVGYVLVELDSPAQAGVLRGCDGVKFVLGGPHGALALPARDVQGVMDAEARMADLFERQKREHANRGLKAGDRVVFRGGVWNGFVATVVDAKSKRAITVMTELFGRMTEVQAPVDLLERAG